MELTKKQDRERHELMGVPYTDNYDIKPFMEISLPVLNQLMDKGYLDPLESYNCAPLVEEYIPFMEKCPEARAHGYLVTPKREDCRISIEGLSVKAKEGESLPLETIFLFTDFFRNADDFSISAKELYCWFD